MQQGSGSSYQLKIINAETKNDVVFYTIQKVVNTSSKLSWQFDERYRNMLNLSTQIQNVQQRMPNFPPKKMFGNTDPEFIQQRKAALQNYFKTLLQYVDVDKIAPLKEFLTRGDPKQVRDAKPEQAALQPAQRLQQTSSQPATQQQFTKAKLIKTEYDKITNETNSKFIDMGFMVNAPDDNDIDKKRFLYDQVKVDQKFAEPHRVPIAKNPDAILMMANPPLESTQPEFFHLLATFTSEIREILR